VALAAALLIQAFLAGMAAMTDPGWWNLHRAWVGVFQWLVLLPPACAVLARYPRWLTGASTLPIMLIYLQYVWAELGRDGVWSYGLGVHAASALVLFGTAVSLLAAALLVTPRACGESASTNTGLPGIDSILTESRAALNGSGASAIPSFSS
jgi:hypothetical protein